MPQGRVGTYDLVVGVKLDMEDMIHQLDPFDVPLLGQYSADGRSALAKGTTNEKKPEWLDEGLLLPRDTLGEALDASETEVTIDTANRFGVGDVILCEAEYMRVTGVDSTGLSLTVTRGYNSSTAATHADNSLLVGTGLALVEGSDPEAARTSEPTARYNMTQIFGPHAIHTTGTEDVIAKYGIKGSQFAKQAGQRAKEIGIGIEQAILYGKRSEDTTAETRTMGGLIYYIATNIDSSTTTLTEATFLDQLQGCYDDGGNPDRAVMGSKNKRLMSGFDATVSDATLNIARGDRQRGTVVDSYVSDFGLVTLLLDRWCRTADLFIFDRDQAQVVTLRPMVFESLAKTGDSTKGQMLCEKSFKFYRERHAARFSALT
jgi:hypothetical protein